MNVEKKPHRELKMTISCEWVYSRVNAMLGNYRCSLSKKKKKSPASFSFYLLGEKKVGKHPSTALKLSGAGCLLNIETVFLNEVIIRC